MNNWKELSVELVCFYKDGNLSVNQNGTSSQKPFENFKGKKKKRLGLIELDLLHPSRCWAECMDALSSEHYSTSEEHNSQGGEAASSNRRSPAVLRQARQHRTLGCAHTSCQNTLFLLDNLRVTLSAVCRPLHHGDVRISTPVTPLRGPSCVWRWLLAPP